MADYEGVDMGQDTCKLDGCDRNDVVKVSGYCTPHHRRVRRTGTVGPAEMSPSVAPPCAVDGCGRKGNNRGYCKTHAYRLRANGDPMTTRPPGATRGAAHPLYRGPEVGCSAVHHRLVSWVGPAKEFTCVACGLGADEWALNNSSLEQQIDPATGFRYSTNLADYAPMCRPCHRTYDLTPGNDHLWSPANELVGMWMRASG